METKQRFKWNCVIFASLLVSVCIVNAQHQVYLGTPNTIPSYCQEDGIWCGAATAQMILEGYPGGVEHVNTQTHIWNRIQAHADDAGVNWATDPDGLKDALMELGGDPGVNWVIYANANAQSLMYTVTYWMTRRSYPTAALVYGFQHWIAIIGFETDVNPVGNNSVNLQFIEIIDPSNGLCPTANSGGVQSLMSGTNWYSNYWYSAGNIAASKWDGNYIAVVEPPINQGVARAQDEIEKGRVITDSAAVEMAQMWIEKNRLAEREPYNLLKRIKPLEPLLVNSEYKGYYIVPFGYRDGEISQAAILVNAYNGDFQEVGVFQNPINYLSEDQAIRLARDYLCYCKSRGKAKLIFQPSQQANSRFLPVWEVTVEMRLFPFRKKISTVYVTQQGDVFERLTSLPLGD
jgi:hypothetical protein